MFYILLKKYKHEIIVFIISFISLSILLSRVVSNYFPTSDDITLLVKSTSLFTFLNPLDWFTNGYLDYFRVYPEWSVTSKEILRPVANIILFINSILFGKNFNYYLYFNIFVHSVGVAITFYLSNKFLNSGNVVSYISSATMFFTSAVTNQHYFFYSSFVLDAVASILIFVAFIFSVKNRSILAFLFTAIILFTKETSLLIPFAVAITLWEINKSKSSKYFVFAFLVILFWSGYKYFFGFKVFGEMGNELFPVIKIFIVNIINAAIIWPSGIPDGYIPGTNNLFPYLLIVIFNMIFIVSFLLDYIKQIKNDNYKYSTLFFWSLMSAFLLIIFGLAGRFGYIFHMFFIPFIFYTFIKSKSLVRKIVYFAYFFWFIFSGITFFTGILRANNLDSYIRNSQNARNLNQLLESVNNNDEILLINDNIVLFGSPCLSDFAGVKCKVTKINSIAHYSYFKTDKNRNSSLKIERKNDCIEIEVLIPDYVDFWFEGVKGDLFTHETKKFFKRNDYLEYCFPEEEFSGISRITGLTKYNLGKKMIVRVKRKDIPLIWFNSIEGKYELFKY
jgi:hypothetical protein